MASIVGVGLDYAKVITEDGTLLTVQEISEENYNYAWKDDEYLTSLAVTIPRSPAPSIPSGNDLLFDIAKYFILTEAVLMLSNSMPHVQTSAGDSSSTRQNKSAQSSSKQWLGKQGSSGQTKGKGTGPPASSPSDDKTRRTTVLLRLLAGGDVHHMTSTDVGAKVSPEDFDDHGKSLFKQLDNTISTEMKFTFIDDPDAGKEIEVTVGPVGFLFSDENNRNYEKYNRHRWYHKTLEVSFAVGNPDRAAVAVQDHKPLCASETKFVDTSGSSTANSKTKSGGLSGGVAFLPANFSVTGGGTTGTTNTGTVGTSNERVVQEVDQFRIHPNVAANGKLRYTFRYRDPNSMSKVDNHILTQMGKEAAYLEPIFTYKAVGFEGRWSPSSSGVEFAKYTFKASREVEMTNKLELPRVKNFFWRLFRTQRHRVGKDQIENAAFRFTQQREKNLLLNHSMMNLGSGTNTYRLQEKLVRNTQAHSHATDSTPSSTRLELIAGTDSNLIRNPRNPPEIVRRS